MGGRGVIGDYKSEGGDNCWRGDKSEGVAAIRERRGLTSMRGGGDKSKAAKFVRHL